MSFLLLTCFRSSTSVVEPYASLSSNSQPGQSGASRYDSLVDPYLTPHPYDLPEGEAAVNPVVSIDYEIVE